MKNETKFRTKESIDASATYFLNQLRVLEQFVEQVSDPKEIGKAGEIFPLLIGIVTSGKATVALTREKYATEVFVLARCFLERTINFCYLMISDKKEVKDFIDHGLQKGYRATSAKKITFNLFGHKFKIQEPNKWLQSKLQKFTRKGRQTNWTPLYFRTRLEKLKEYCPEFDLAFFCNLYEDGSESSHGTFYGTLFHTGILSEAQCPNMGLQYINAYITLTLCKLADLIMIAFQVIAANVEKDISKYMQKLEENCSVVNAFFKKMETEA
jgi:hypothetical protein